MKIRTEKASTKYICDDEDRCVAKVKCVSPYDDPGVVEVYITVLGAVVCTLRARTSDAPKITEIVKDYAQTVIESGSRSAHEHYVGNINLGRYLRKKFEFLGKGEPDAQG